MLSPPPFFLFFFFNDTATTEIYTLSLHDALPICSPALLVLSNSDNQARDTHEMRNEQRSEEHTSELQSHLNLVCRLLLEKKKRRHSERPAVPYPRARREKPPAPRPTYWAGRCPPL